MSQYLIGIDSGNTVCKVTLFDCAGEVVSIASTKIPTCYPAEGHSERDPEQMWKLTAATIRKTIVRASVKPENIAAVGICGHGNGLYMLDKSSRPLRGIQSVDTRAVGICRDWQKKNLIDTVYPLTFQHFWPAQTNTLLAWFRQQEPVTFERCRTAFLSKDYLNYRLTGEIASDFSDISVTNLFDNTQRQYSKPLLRLYGLEEAYDKLPPVRRSTEITGAVCKAAAGLTGLLPGTPVVTGMLDVSANMVGSGVTSPGELSVIAGTWSVNSILTPAALNHRELAMTALFTDPALYVAIEASPTSLTNLEWFVNRFCMTEKRAAGRKGISVYDLCDHLVQQHKPAGLPVVYLPFLYGANHHANAKAGFVGISGNHTKTDMLRALYEGIVYSHRMHIDNLRKAGATFHRVRLTGGASRSRVFGQLFADILNETIEVPALTETGTWGAAMTAGIGTGIYEGYHTHGTGLAAVYEPVRRDVEKYELMYRNYTSLLENLDPYWH